DIFSPSLLFSYFLLYLGKTSLGKPFVCLFFSQNRSQFIFDEMRWQPITPLSKSLEALFRKC
ncbi:TPA: hypothetical protein ACQOJF_001652, partial [Streptococcus pyogenes]